VEAAGKRSWGRWSVAATGLGVYALPMAGGTAAVRTSEVDEQGRSASQGSQPDADAAGRLTGRWLGAALLIAAVVVPLFRQQGTPSWKTVWAEDGAIYTQQTVLRGSARTLFEGYNGYLQLPPRLLVIPTPFFSLRYLALYCALAGTITAALLALCVYHFTQGWISSKVLRVALASLVVVAPTMGIDSTATPTNTIWMFLAVLPWALISLEETRRDTVLRAIVVFLAATSSELSLIFVPLAVGWWLYRRTRSALTVGVVFLAGVVVQMVVTSATRGPLAQHYKLATAVPDLLRDISVRVFGVFLFGTNWEADLWHASWVVLVIIGPVLVVTFFGLLMPGAGRRAQVMSGAFVLLAMAAFSTSVWGRGLPSLLLTAGHPDSEGYIRFSTPAIMFMASAFAIVMAPVGAAAFEAKRRIAVVAFVVQITVLAVVCFSVVNARGYDTPWVGRVERAVTEHCIDRTGSKLVTIPNTGVSSYFGGPQGLFPVTVHCSNVR
jgi:hypothetical protein